MTRLTQACSAFLLVLLAACASMGVAPADTFGKKVIVANSVVEAVADTAGTLYDAGKLTSADVQKIVTQLKDARMAIAIAHQIHATNPMEAETRLDAVIASLRLMQATLESWNHE